MADSTKIEWTDATWNPVTGCSVISAGCTNCYAMQLAGTRLAHHPSRAGLTKPVNGNHVWTGEVRLNEDWLLQPLRWKKPRRIFVCAHGDLFHEAVPDEWIDRVFAVMALCPQHTFQVLTKRSARIREYLSCHRWHLWAGHGRAMSPSRWAALPPIIGGDCTPLPNVWLGVSVEDQARADERILDLLATPAAKRFLSCEPLLEEVLFDPCELARLDWIIVGGESGPNARPLHPDWARSLRDQCAIAGGVPFFFKQWGEWELSLDREKDDPDWRADYSNNHVDFGKSRWLNIEGGRGFHGDRFVVMRNVGKKRAGRLLDGREWSEFPGA